MHKHKSLASTSTLPQKFDKSNFKDKFPSVGEAITEKTSFGDDKDNWGFISGESDFENIQAPSDSDSTTQTWFKGHWEWEPSTETSAKKLTDWSSNSTQWVGEIYSEVATKNKIKKHFEDMKGT